MSDLFPTTVEMERLRLEPRAPEYVGLFERYDICANDDGIDEVTDEGADEHRYTISQAQWCETTGGERTATFR